MDFPIENGDFPYGHVSLPGDSVDLWWLMIKTKNGDSNGFKNKTTIPIDSNKAKNGDSNFKNKTTIPIAIPQENHIFFFCLVVLLPFPVMGGLFMALF